MTKGRKAIRILLILLIAYFTQRIRMSELNSTVWYVTYIGEHVAHVVHPADYDSALSTAVFQMIAILVNALVYALVLWPIGIWIERFRLRRKTRKVSVA